MAVARPFALVRTIDQWARCSHRDTAVLASGEVSLAWVDPEREDVAGPLPDRGSGLAFDSSCVLYHGARPEGRIERLLWAAVDAFGLPTAQPQPVALLHRSAEGPVGDFSTAEPSAAFVDPLSLAVDDDDRLFVADGATGRILVFDLWSRRLLRRVVVPGAGGQALVPLDLACRGRTVWAVARGLDGALRMEARRGSVLVDLPTGPADLPPEASVRRVAVSPAGELFVLYRDAGGAAWVVGAGTHQVVRVGGATDVEFDGDGALVVAREPGADFLRVRAGFADMPLKARGYDGRGIVRTPDGRIGFWTADGFRHAVPARIRYRPTGRVTTYRVDSGEHQMEWGRLFVEACIPHHTGVRAHFATADDDLDEPALPRTLPANLVDYVVRRPDLSPPMAPVVQVPGPGQVVRPLHRRETGRELPWSRPAATDRFETFEAPIDAAPGRYLWVTLELTGNERFSPKVRSVRAGYPTHDLLQRLPRTFSREPAVASFLTRFLAMFEGTLADLDGRAGERQILVDPRATPEELLPWLASFVGLVLDERWPDAARRTLVSEAAELFRFRGTPRALGRMLEIYLGFAIVIAEQFRFRGLGGLAGGDDTGPVLSTSVLGGGFRVGGTVGDAGVPTAGGDLDDGFRTNAHRFSVVIPAVLSEEQADVVRDVLDRHRPAHTMVDVCSVGTGFRVGGTGYLGISSIIGPTSGFTPLRLGGSLLGAGSTVGRAGPGAPLGTSRVGRGIRIG